MGEQRGTRILQDHLLATYDRCTDLGIYNPRSVFEGSQRPSHHAEGRALDLGVPFDDIGRAQGSAAFLWLYDNRAALDLVQLIYDGFIWTAFHPGIRPYSGLAHTDHIHCAQGWAGARAESPWYFESVAPPEPSVEVPVEEDDDMTVMLAKHTRTDDGRWPAYTLKHAEREVWAWNDAPLAPYPDVPVAETQLPGLHIIRLDDIAKTFGVDRFAGDPIGLFETSDGGLAVLMSDGGTIDLHTGP